MARRITLSRIMRRASDYYVSLTGVLSPRTAALCDSGESDTTNMRRLTSPYQTQRQRGGFEVNPQHAPVSAPTSGINK